MKSGVILINNDRGGVVDETALLSALDSKKVAFATMDVFEMEPPKAGSPLINHERVFVTPHCAWNTQESIGRLTDIAIDNIRKYLGGSVVNEVRG